MIYVDVVHYEIIILDYRQLMTMNLSIKDILSMLMIQNILAFNSKLRYIFNKRKVSNDDYQSSSN